MWKRVNNFNVQLPKGVGALIFWRPVLIGVGAGFVHSMTSTVVGNLRGRDDEVNWFCAGLSTAYMARTFDKRVSLPMLGVAAVLSAFIKHGINDSWRFLGTRTYVPHYGVLPQQFYISPSHQMLRAKNLWEEEYLETHL